LQALQRVHLCLQFVQLGHDPALLGKRREGFEMDKAMAIPLALPARVNRKSCEK